MLSRPVSSLILTVITTGLLASCGAQGTMPTPMPSNGQQQTNQPSYQQLKFGPLSPANANMIGQDASGAVPTVAPSAAPMPGSAGEARSSMIAPGYYYGNPPPGEEYVLDTISEATIGGFTGTYKNALSQVAQSLVQGWASDARLIDSGGTSDGNGQNPNYGAELSRDDGWRFTFTSASLKESLNIYISGRQTLVIKHRWVLKNLDSNAINIDSDQVLQKVKQAVLDRNFKPTDNANDGQYVDPNSETLYEIPANTNWSLYLFQENGRLLWNVNMNIYSNNDVAVAIDAKPMTEPMPVATPTILPTPMPVTSWVSGGSATVDAKTGEIIRLYRPMRYRMVQPTAVPMAEPPRPSTAP